LAHVAATMLLVLAAWWISTGLIVLAVRQFEHRHAAVIAAATLLAAAGVAIVIVTAGVATSFGAIAAFIGALMIWSFFEVTFLLGWITGPRRDVLPPGVSGFARFRLAAETVLHHELALAAALVVLAAAMKDAANHVALMTFLLLWIMRLAAKLILFLGARHSLSALMPERLAYLQSYFRTDRTTRLFPAVLVAGICGLGFLAHTAFSGGTPFIVTAHVLAATFLALALAELILLNLPLRDSALWSWALPKAAKGEKTPLS
jgi:putative photosynthetic complex assembly protein 2